METDAAPGGTPPAAAPPSRLAPIIERAPLPMVEVEGPEHIVRYVNTAFCVLMGKKREELVGQPFAGAVSDDPKCVELLTRVYETGRAETHAALDEFTPAYWLYAMWPALDERNQPERVVIQLTKAGGIRDDMVALNEALLLGSLQQFHLREAAETANQALEREIAERRHAEARLQAAQDALQASAEHLEQVVDERTAQLRASMEELEAFAYSLAHDLRAPIRAIHGFTEFALELPKEEVGPAAAGFLHRVIKAAVRMDSLIQDVLALSQVIKRPISVSTVDVDDLVRALIQERPEFSEVRAQIRIDGPLLPVIGHEASLSQCLTNLLSNAVKFVETGARPCVRVRTEALAAGDAPPMVRIWVEDQGIGVPAEDRDRIFQIFQRLHGGSAYEGSGIGLAIVRKAVERMGGRAGVAADDGPGSRFWLDLPAAG